MSSLPILIMTSLMLVPLPRNLSHILHLCFEIPLRYHLLLQDFYDLPHPLHAQCPSSAAPEVPCAYLCHGTYHTVK